MRPPSGCFKGDVTVDKNVLGFDVPVNDVVRVHKVDATHHLVHDLFGLDLAQANLGPLDLLEQILLDKLKHQIDAAVASEDLDQIDEVLVTQRLKYFDLARRYLLHRFVVVGLEELFDGHDGPVCLVFAFEHDPVAALAHRAYAFVFVHSSHRHDLFFHKPSSRGIFV